MFHAQALSLPLLRLLNSLHKTAEERSFSEQADASRVDAADAGSATSAVELWEPFEFA